ncbi:MAG: hypothetical protein MJ252_24225 [archaeon]|nr:hypothetical protein [archaeon]
MQPLEKESQRPLTKNELRKKMRDIKRQKKETNYFYDNSTYPGRILSKKEFEEEYITEMFGRKGWICGCCNNFNYYTRNKCNRCSLPKTPKKIADYLNLIEHKRDKNEILYDVNSKGEDIKQLLRLNNLNKIKAKEEQLPPQNVPLPNEFYNNPIFKMSNPENINLETEQLINKLNSLDLNQEDEKPEEVKKEEEKEEGSNSEENDSMFEFDKLIEKEIHKDYLNDNESPQKTESVTSLNNQNDKNKIVSQKDTPTKSKERKKEESFENKHLLQNTSAVNKSSSLYTKDPINTFMGFPIGLQEPYISQSKSAVNKYLSPTQGLNFEDDIWKNTNTPQTINFPQNQRQMEIPNQNFLNFNTQFQNPLFSQQNKAFIQKKKNQSIEHNKGNWICPRCRNLNYFFRTVCNRCKIPNPYAKKKYPNQESNTFSQGFPHSNPTPKIPSNFIMPDYNYFMNQPKNIPQVNPSQFINRSSQFDFNNSDISTFNSAASGPGGSFMNLNNPFNEPFFMQNKYSFMDPKNNQPEEDAPNNEEDQK